MSIYQKNEFAERARKFGKHFLSKPEVATVLGVSYMGLWRWLGTTPKEDHPNWSRIAGINFLTADETVAWCLRFAEKYPEKMARRQLREDEQ